MIQSGKKRDLFQLPQDQKKKRQEAPELSQGNKQKSSITARGRWTIREALKIGIY